MNSKKTIPLIITVLIVIAGYFIYKKLNPKEIPPYLVEAVGRVDADVINLNTKYPGRIVKLNVNTGDSVKKGKVIAVLNSKEFQSRLDALDEQIKAKREELKVLKNKVKNSIKKATYNINAKKAQIQGVEAQIASIAKVIAQDKKDENRLRTLVKKKLAKEHELEMAVLKTQTDTDKLKGLKAQKQALKAALDAAVKDLNTAKAQKNSVKAAEFSIQALVFQKKEVRTMINEMTLISPVDGFVDTKIANRGEMLGAGMPVVSIIDGGSFYLKIYVDEITNGKIKLHQKAEIFLDSFPDKPIPAVVTKIAKRAEFTPKEVAVRSDRITRVYEVHLKPLKPNAYLKLGLPATGVVLTGSGALPKTLDELPEL